MKINLILFIRLMIVQVSVVILYLPLMILPFKWNFPHIYRLAIKFFLWANKVKIYNLTDFDINQYKACIFSSNHKCFADPLFIARFLDNPFTFTMSQHVLNIFPPFKIVAAKMKFIGIDKKNYSKMIVSIEKIKKRIEEGISVIYFPEGYYTIDKPVGDIKGGIAKIAKITEKDVIPVAIYGIDQRYIYSKPQNKNVYIKFGRPIKYSDYNDDFDFIKALKERIEKLYEEIENEVKK